MFSHTVSFTCLTVCLYAVSLPVYFLGGVSKEPCYKYPMDSKPHGRALIINNVKYPKNPRYTVPTGTRRHCKRLSRRWDMLSSL